MIENYDIAFELLKKLEGFHSNLKDDPGGNTIVGFSSKFYPAEYAELIKLSKSGSDVVYCRAKELYKKLFWDKYMCDNLPDKIDILYFLTAVNTPRGQKVMAFSVGSFENECLDIINYYFEGNSPYKLGLIGRILHIWRYLK